MQSLMNLSSNKPILLNRSFSLFLLLRIVPVLLILLIQNHPVPKFCRTTAPVGHRAVVWHYRFFPGIEDMRPGDGAADCCCISKDFFSSLHQGQIPHLSGCQKRIQYIVVQLTILKLELHFFPSEWHSMGIYDRKHIACKFKWLWDRFALF